MKQPRTMRRTIATTTANNLLCGVLLAASFAVTSHLTSGWTEVQPYTTSEQPSQVETLLADHDCWTGSEHPDVIPGHVVVTVDGVTRLAGAKVTGQALEQVINHVDHGLTVHGFCS